MSRQCPFKQPSELDAPFLKVYLNSCKHLNDSGESRQSNRKQKSIHAFSKGQWQRIKNVNNYKNRRLL